MKYLLQTALFILLSAPVFQAGAYYPPPAGHTARSSQTDPAPSEILRNNLNRIRDFMQEDGPRDPATVLRFLQDEIAQHFELERMAEWIAGPYYRRMGVEERAKFQNRLKEKMLTAISRQLGIFSNRQLRLNFFPPRRSGPADVSVGMRILHPDQPPIRMVFRFHHAGPDGWKIYDVSIGGISAIAYYRDYYRQAVNRFGPQGLFR